DGGGMRDVQHDRPPGVGCARHRTRIPSCGSDHHAASRAAAPVGWKDVRPATVAERRRLYLLSRVVVARHYRRHVTLEAVAGVLASSPRQLQRAYAQFGQVSFHEDLLERRMSAAAQLLAEQPGL